MALSRVISEIKRFFSYHLAFDAPVKEVPVGVLPLRLVWKKLQYGSMVWLPSGEKTLMIYLAISTEHWRVTDGQTDGRTDRHLATA